MGLSIVNLTDLEDITMSFSLKPDYEKTKERYDAWWHNEIVDRPPVNISFPVERPKPVPQKNYATWQEKWLDFDYRAEAANLELHNQVFYADSLPIVWPNLGPEVFSAWCGCGYRFGEHTTWSEPCILDWEKDAEQCKLDMNHWLFKAVEDFTRRLLEYGKGNFIVGLTDFHPGGDHLAALRDPQNLAVDMIEHVDEIKTMLKQSEAEFFQAYDYFYNLLRAENMPITTWTPLIHDGRYYVPSNDFSCMISNEMFEDIFLQGIINECHFYERSIYHLDGPGALRHLDSLLSIKELNAVQWVPGAGREGYERWIKVYQKIQAAGKGIQLGISIEELPLVFETLKPEGVWFASISGVNDRNMADEVLARISKWK